MGEKFKLKHAGLIFAFVLLFGLIGFTAVGAINVVKAYAGDENGDSSDDVVEDAPSFSSMTQAAASYLGKSMMPSSGTNGVVKQMPLNAGNGGGYIAFVGKDVEWGQWITSLLTTASAKVGYKTYESVLYSDNGDESNAMYLYSVYGASLHAMGFDSTGTASSGKMVRAIGGWILYFLYTLSGFVPGMFKVAIKVLQTVNPFQIFSVETMQNIISPTNAPAQGSVTDTIGHAMNYFYDALYYYGWTICMPLFLGLVLLELYVFKKTKASTAIKKLVLRMAAIGMGIPLLGATYTQILNMIASDLSAGNTASTRVVCSILLDFGSWAENRRLDWFPGDTLYVVVDNTTGKVDVQSASVYKQRRICLTINAKSNPIFGTLESNVSNAYGLNSALAVTSNLYHANDSGDYTEQVFNECQNLIKRYINGDTYTSADWETRVKSTIDSSAVVTLMSKTDSLDDFEVPKENEYFGETIDGTTNLWGSGYLDVTIRKDFSKDDEQDESVNWGNSKLYVRFWSIDNEWRKDGYRLGSIGGLSHMALYNYLNTSFGSSSLTLYSTTDSTSLFTREQHYAVNLIGGSVSFGYWFNAAALLLAFIVLGFAYAGSMIFYIISRSIRMLLAIPGMLLGSIKAFGKVIVYTISMIMQVLATIVLYNIATLLLESIDDIITTPLIGAVAPSAALYVGNQGVSALSVYNIGYFLALLLIGGIVQLIFVFFAIKERRTIVKGINEAAQQIIDKLLDTNATADNSPTAAQRLAGAGAAAAGGAAAAKFAKGRSGKNNGGDKNDSVEDTKNAQKNDDAAGTGGGDETPDATGAGGESDKDGTGSGGIEGEEKALGSGGDTPGIEENADAAAGATAGAASGAAAGEEAAGKDDSDGTGSGSDGGSSGEGASDAEIAAEAENAESLSEMSDTSEGSEDAGGEDGADGAEGDDGSEDGSDGDDGDGGDSGEDGDPSGPDVGEDAGAEGSGGADTGGESSSDSGSASGGGASGATAAGAAAAVAAGGAKSAGGAGAKGSSGGASKSGIQGKGGAKSTAGAKKSASANGAKAGVAKGAKASTDGKPKGAAGSGGGSKSFNEAKAAAQKRIDTAKEQAAKNSAAAAKKNDAKSAKNAKAAVKAKGSAKSGSVKGAKPSSAGPSIARQAMANMAAVGVATAVATALGADAQTAAQAGQMAMMSASMANYSGGGNNNSAGDTSSTAGGGSAPSAGGGGVSAAASAAMPRGAGGPVSGGTIGVSADSGGAAPRSMPAGGGGSAQPAGIQQQPSSASGSPSSEQGGLSDTMSASEAAEIVRMNKEAQRLEHQNRVQMRSNTLVGRAFNAVEAAPGNAVRSVANTAVGAARGVKNGAVSVKNDVVNTATQAVGGVKHVANGVQQYGKSVSASHTMKKQNKELNAFVKAEAKREKRIEKATRRK